MKHLTNIFCEPHIKTYKYSKLYFVSEYIEYTKNAEIYSISKLIDIDIVFPHNRRWIGLVFYCEDTHSIYRFISIDRYDFLKKITY